MNRATEKQVAFIMRLAAERELVGKPGYSQAEVESITKAEASLLINALLDTPKPVQQRQSKIDVDVPAGRYAVEIGGHLHFFKVDRPTAGRWAGYTFLTRQYGDNFEKIRGSEAADILSRIVKDVDAALMRYGVELGVCGICGRSLTDDESRARGIGPECARKRAQGRKTEKHERVFTHTDDGLLVEASSLTAHHLCPICKDVRIVDHTEHDCVYDREGELIEWKIQCNSKTLTIAND